MESWYTLMLLGAGSGRGLNAKVVVVVVVVEVEVNDVALRGQLINLPGVLPVSAENVG